MNVGQLREQIAGLDNLTPVCVLACISSWTGEFAPVPVVDTALSDVRDAGYSSGTVGLVLRP